MRRLVLGLLGAAAFLGAASAEAAILVVNGSGQLTGATGVTVNGTLYDVQLTTGTCATDFNGCDDQSDFTFSTQSDATAAAQALLDQVFINGADGNFDSNPILTAGCQGGNFICDAIVFYSPTALMLAVNGNDQAGDGVSGPFLGVPNTGGTEFDVLARFTPAAAVPEPSTWAMMLLGFGAVGFTLRRSRQTALTFRRAA
jgi:hypothetical protein